MNKILATLITDQQSLEAITKILYQQGFKEIEIPNNIWRSLFIAANAPYSVAQSWNINGINVSWVGIRDGSP